MIDSIEEIFDFAYSAPTQITNETNDVSLSLIRCATSNLVFGGFRGCEIEMVSHKTLIFNSSFKTLSANYNITWKGATINVELSCPYPEFINYPDPDSFVRLYTQHPVSNQTIYAYMIHVWNFRPAEYLFRFLLNDYTWFADNLPEIRKAVKEQAADSASLIESFDLHMSNIVSPSSNKVIKGKIIASELIKNTFKS